MTFESFLESVDDIVWGIPTIVLILLTGILLTIRTRGIQFTKLALPSRLIFKKNNSEGELSFRALKKEPF